MEDGLAIAISHQSCLRSTKGEAEGPGLQWLTVGTENALEQIHFQPAEALERLGELELQHPVRAEVLRREVGGGRRFTDALRLEVVHPNPPLQRPLIDVP